MKMNILNRNNKKILRLAIAILFFIIALIVLAYANLNLIMDMVYKINLYAILITYHTKIIIFNYVGIDIFYPSFFFDLIVELVKFICYFIYKGLIKPILLIIFYPRFIIRNLLVLYIYNILTIISILYISIDTLLVLHGSYLIKYYKLDTIIPKLEYYFMRRNIEERDYIINNIKLIIGLCLFTIILNIFYPLGHYIYLFIYK